MSLFSQVARSHGESMIYNRAGGGCETCRLNFHQRRLINIVEKKEYVRPRNANLAFRVTEEERILIERRMVQAGIKNMRAFIVKMAIDGRVIRVELDSVKEMVRLLSNVSNNINQIARRVNTDGSVYAADVDELRERYDEIWAQAKTILRKIAEM